MFVNTKEITINVEDISYILKEIVNLITFVLDDIKNIENELPSNKI